MQSIVSMICSGCGLLSAREVWETERDARAPSGRREGRGVETHGCSLLSARGAQSVGYCQQERCGRQRGVGGIEVWDAERGAITPSGIVEGRGEE